ncbi:hypothetical protein EI42_02543 [Thermosporothrix hazakensis]|jgi:hypothetical protein|uniref:Uncharacterized protein n=2 Tax=Thermosporothrix TaxID=768650 RepID=A0A326UB99_THEHA|nr:hypothetical protein [Thermosporothrix hazakensis]PZW30571.1 hypothetical protein EI42_02543 [Thermosporothrix hazakensis]BBH91286.1 hypothetical protein KTC_60370 [Thermosporothrix sp. COM3]GCE49433.1 hypothetical protein KTH_43020 [Thermosporothrix hazakensis]
MDAILGRYQARVEERGMVLRHASGLSFDLTAEESLALLDFLSAYRQTLYELQEKQKKETEPRLKRIRLEPQKE